MVSLNRESRRGPATSNRRVAQILEEVSDSLRLQAANPFRIEAFRKAARAVRKLSEPLALILERDGNAGLRQIPGVGKSLASAIAEIVQTGQLGRLTHLEENRRATNVLTSLPGIGPQLAERIHQALGADSLEEVYAAAYDGRLRQVAGVGRKRMQTIRECLTLRLDRPQPVTRRRSDDEPTVALLLELDREYRTRAANGTLPTVAPQRFNPTGAVWLPILRTDRGGRRFCVLYSNSQRAHALDHTHDWVVIYDDSKRGGQWTVLTSRFGPSRGRRVVRGREAECWQHYRQMETQPAQLALPGMASD